ncbi:hypothetical protein Anas_10725 [Armadillidium nasatum]|uniref:Uncharacterized protein n=1 Tax=Armadillidium nasatum TaxID=96803 RepID=A0A5N5T706_9CRUS|nr:hypothetical protein Anas_10725 [Armadillidium nasatum]
METMQNDLQKMRKSHSENLMLTFTLLQLLSSTVGRNKGKPIKNPSQEVHCEIPPSTLKPTKCKLQSKENVSREDIFDVSDADVIFPNYENERDVIKINTTGNDVRLMDSEKMKITSKFVSGCSESKKLNCESEEKENCVKKWQFCDYCKKEFKYLSSHLKVHGLLPDERKKIVHEKRKRKPMKGKRVRRCPFAQCAKAQPYVRLDKHLQSFHKLKLDHPMYKKFVNTHSVRHKPLKLKSKSNEEPEKSSEPCLSAEQEESNESCEQIGQKKSIKPHEQIGQNRSSEPHEQIGQNKLNKPFEQTEQKEIN